MDEYHRLINELCSYRDAGIPIPGELEADCFANGIDPYKFMKDTCEGAERK